MAAAKNAMAARSQVSDLELATVNTTGKGANGANFNYVRNIKVKRILSNVVGGSLAAEETGMLTDNHKDFSSIDDNYLYYNDQLVRASYVTEYESEVDRTMQLMKYTMENGRSVILANFQTHPHLGADPKVPMVHADIVGAFRDDLKTETTDVIYFSGASGDVNPRDAHLSGTSYAKETLQEYKTYGADLAAIPPMFPGSQAAPARRWQRPIWTCLQT